MTVPSRFVALAVGLGLAAVVTAQVPKPPDPGRVKQAVFSMRNGTVRVKDDPKNRENLKTFAQWLAFSIAQPPFNGEPVPAGTPKLPPSQDNMAYLMGEAESYIAKEIGGLPVGTGSLGKPSQEQIEFSDEMGKAIGEACKVVLDQSARPIERINAVRLMSIAARVPAPSLADYLVAVVKNEKASDAEKLYALQGLRNLLEQSDVNDATKSIFPPSVAGPKLSEIGLALDGYVFQKRGPKDDRERQVIEFVRRDGVGALARFKDNAYRKPTREFTYRPAWSLARVMEQDPTVSPPFTIQEQTEAAIGFCQQKIDPDLNLDVAAYTLAKMLVIFAREANLDFQRANESKTLPIYHWKIAAARWSYNLAVWRGYLTPLPKTRGSDSALNLVRMGIDLLTEVEKNGAGAATGSYVQAITGWARDNPPKAWAISQDATLFKDDPTTRLPFPAAPNPNLKTPAAADPKADPKKGPAPKATDPKTAAPSKGETPVKKP